MIMDTVILLLKEKEHIIDIRLSLCFDFIKLLSNFLYHITTGIARQLLSYSPIASNYHNGKYYSYNHSALIFLL